MLLSVIDKDFSEKAELITQVLDSVKVYINPQMFKEELVSRGVYVDEYNKVNSEFEQQSRIGHATGYMKSSDRVQEYLKKFYSTVSKDPSEVIYLTGPNGTEIQQMNLSNIPTEDPEELG